MKKVSALALCFVSLGGNLSREKHPAYGSADFTLETIVQPAIWSGNAPVDIHWRDYGISHPKRYAERAGIVRYIQRLRSSFRLQEHSSESLIRHDVQRFWTLIAPEAGILFSALSKRKFLGPANANKWKAPAIYHLDTKAPTDGFADDAGIYGEEGHILAHEFIAFMGLPHIAGVAFELLYLKWLELGKPSSWNISKILRELENNFADRLQREKIFNSMLLSTIYTLSRSHLKGHAKEYASYKGRRPDLLASMAAMEKKAASSTRWLGRGFLNVLMDEAKKCEPLLFRLDRTDLERLLRETHNEQSNIESMDFAKSVFLTETYRKDALSMYKYFPLLFSWLDEVALTGYAEWVIAEWGHLHLTAHIKRKAAQMAESPRPHPWGLTLTPGYMTLPTVIEKAWRFDRHEILNNNTGRDMGARRCA